MGKNIIIILLIIICAFLGYQLFMQQPVEQPVPVVTEVVVADPEPEPEPKQIIVTKPAEPDTVFYSATFDDGTGSIIGVQTVVEGDRFIEPKDPESAGYRFEGWYEKDAVSAWDFTAVVSADTTLTAHWVPAHYIVTYHLDGGINAGANPTEFTSASGNIDLQSPSRAGYAFAGWYTDESLSQGITSIPTGSNDDIDLYADWEEETFAISYFLDGGENHAYNPSSFTAGSDEIFLWAPEKAGYTFTGWFNTDNYSKEIDTIPSGTTESLNLYAQWSADTYRITTVLNGGEVSYLPPESYTIASSTIYLPVPKQEGFEFTGWTKDTATSTETNAKTISKGSTGDIVLIAGWELEEYTISYVLNGGMNNRANQSSFTRFQDDVFLLDPSRPGYRFSGWFIDESLENPVTGINAQVAGDTRLYASWDLEKYAISYYLDGGRNHVSNPAEFSCLNDEFTLSRPTKSGYTFLGWYADPEFKTEANGIDPMVREDVEKYAKWVQNTPLSSFTYLPNEDGIRITGFTGTESEIWIPSVIDDRPVTAIGEYAFYESSTVKSVSIPDSVKRIEEGSFSFCTNLEEIKIPDSVDSIGYAALYDCASITELTIPESVTSIGNGAFACCTGLRSITIPEQVTKLDKFVFSECPELTDIYCEIAFKPEAWDAQWNKNEIGYTALNANIHWDSDNNGI